MKTLLVVSGGEAPGLNAAFYHYALIASGRGDVVLGAHGSFAGLLEDRIVELTPALLAPWAGLGGSYLTSNRAAVLKADDARERLHARLAAHGVDNLILFGGNGTLRHIPPLLESWGVAHVCIPTTIDNDVPGTERTLGFDSACNYAYTALDGLLATARAMPGRVFTLETLGGDSGFIALEVAAAAAAHAVLLPEYAYTLDWLGQRTAQALARDGFALIVLSEGAARRETLTDDLARAAGVRVRDVRLGHAQRGSHPSHIDRLLAATLMQRACESLQQGARRGTFLLRDGRWRLDEEGIARFARPLPDPALYNRLNGLS
jgi:6-phosphofructokinase 1